MNKKILDYTLGISLALLAIFIVISGDSVYKQFLLSKEMTAPVSDWVNVDAVEIINSDVDEPLVIFTRSIRKNLIGEWSTSVIQTDTGRIACVGNGKAHYTIDEEPVKKMALSEFIGVKECAFLVKGREYQLEVNWFFTDPNSGLTKSLRATSNYFTM